jgi:hypothetical protein
MKRVAKVEAAMIGSMIVREDDWIIDAKWYPANTPRKNKMHDPVTIFYSFESVLLQYTVPVEQYREHL